MSGSIIDKLVVSLTMNAAGYIKTAGTVVDTNKKLVDNSGKMASTLEGQGKKLASFWTVQKIEALGLIGVLAAGAKALESFTVKTANAVAATGRFAEAENTTPERISGLRAVAKEYGSTADAANSAVNSIINAERNYLKTGQSSTQLALLTQMGIKFVDPKTGKLEDSVTQIEQIAEKLKKMPLQAAIATGEMLGWSDTFTNALVKSPGNLAQLIQSQITTTKANVKAGEALVQAEGQLAAATAKLDNDIMTGLVPVLLPIFHFLTLGMGRFDDLENNGIKFGPPNGPLYPGSPGAPTADHSSFVPEHIAPPASGSAAAGVEEQLRAFYKSKGMSDAQIAGLLSNVAAESGFDPTRSGDNGTSYGLFQFHGARLAALRARYGNSPTVQQQAQFMWDELHGSEAAAGSRFLATTTPGAAGAAFTGVERPEFTAQRSRERALAAALFMPTSGVSPHVTSVLNGLRAQQAAGGNKTTVNAPITINGAQSPAATGRAVQQHLNAMASQAARGLQ